MNNAQEPNTNPSTFRRISTEIFLVIGITVIIFMMIFLFKPRFSTLALLIPYAYYLFAINNDYLIVKLQKRKIIEPQFYLLTLLFSILGYLPFLVLITLIHGRYSDKTLIAGIITILIVVPFSMYYFSKNKFKRQTIADLKKDLGKTTAEMKLMQSQINPHFLFNVMNSIYGIALQEDAPRTADSVQRLSQMMRFMLFENQQDYILLSRDLNYLREYVAIQSLRVENIPSVKIESDIVDPTENFYISPMLLIPFVENAFKHGISMEEPSWIKVNAEIQDQQLKFSVYNSIHQLEGTDLERNKSGIGLENVQSRLNIFYPGKHLLVIEQNQQEFFVFLTVDLKVGSNNKEVEEQDEQGN